jgi:hypothetical protein
MRKIKLMVAAAAFCSGLTAGAASAMPIAPLPETAGKIEYVYWACGPYGRCRWVPNYYYGYGYHPYRYYGYGYHPYRYYGYRYYPYRRYYWRHRYWRRHHRHYW